MKKREIEQKIKTAADHAAPHQLDAILSACEAQKGTVIDMTEYRKNHKKRWIPAVAVAAALVLVLMGGWFLSLIHIYCCQKTRGCLCFRFRRRPGRRP